MIKVLTELDYNLGQGTNAKRRSRRSRYKAVVYDADFKAFVPATEATVTCARLSKEIDPFRNITTPL